MNLPLGSVEEISKTFGITEDELLDRMIAHLLEVDGAISLEDLEHSLSGRIQTIVEAAVDRMADEEVVPMVEEIIGNFVLQETTTWGEKKGEAMSLTEFIVQRSETWIREEVNREGKSRSEYGNSYNWRGRSSRMEWLMEKKLDRAVESAMEKIISTANEQLAGGLKAAIVAHMNQMTKRISVKVTDK